MIAVFELGTLWFWLLIVGVLIGLMIIQENAEYPGRWCTIWIVATFFTLYYCGAGLSMKELGSHIYHNPMETVVYFLLYTVVGTLWSFYKWGVFVRKQADKYSKAVDRYNKDVQSGYRACSPPDVENHIPELAGYKGDIFNWIFCWPISGAWFCIHKPIENLFGFIMDNTKRTYEGITRRTFDKIVSKTPKAVRDDMVHK